MLDEPLSYAMNFALVEDGLYMIAALAWDSPGILYFFDFATSRLTPLITIQRWAYGLAVSPDGQSVLYSQREQQSGSLMLVENFR